MRSVSPDLECLYILHYQDRYEYDQYIHHHQNTKKDIENQLYINNIVADDTLTNLIHAISIKSIITNAHE